MPILKRSVQGRKHQGMCTFAESELLSTERSKYVVQNQRNGHKNPNYNHNYPDDIELYHEISKRNTEWHSTPEKSRTQTSPIDWGGLQLTNAQSHMLPISKIWCREFWTIQFKYTFETKQGSIISSNTPSWPHQPLLCICLFGRAYFNYLDNKLSIGTRKKRASGGNTSSNPQVLALITRPASNGMERMCHIPHPPTHRF